MWQQLIANNHAETGQVLQLMIIVFIAVDATR